MNILSKFSMISGLSHNVHKSTIFMSNYKVHELKTWFDDQFGVPRGSIQLQFLGVTLISEN